MKFYNDFNSMFQAQSGLKKDMSVFNRVYSSEWIDMLSAHRRLEYLILKEGDVCIMTLASRDVEPRPDGTPFYLEIGYKSLMQACDIEPYMKGFSDEEYEAYKARQKDRYSYLREFCISKITDYCATHHIIITKKYPDGQFELNIPEANVDEFAQYLDDLVSDCGQTFKHWKGCA